MSRDIEDDDGFIRRIVDAIEVGQLGISNARNFTSVSLHGGRSSRGPTCNHRASRLRFKSLVGTAVELDRDRWLLSVKARVRNVGRRMQRQTGTARETTRARRMLRLNYDSVFFSALIASWVRCCSGTTRVWTTCRVATSSFSRSRR
jgi:hypothetical protein